MKHLFSSVLTLAAMLVITATTAHATTPVATSFSFTVSTVGSSQVQLQGSDLEGTPLAFAIVATPNPATGSLSSLVAASGYVVFTPATAYVGVTTFTFNVTSGAETSSTATCTVTVTNAKTRVIDTLLDPSGAAKQGIVTFVLTQKAQSPGGLIPLGATASAVLNSVGQFDISIYPSTSLVPQSYYQLWYQDVGSIRRELIGVYTIPALTTTTTLAPNQVTNTNLAAQYTFASALAVNAMVSGGLSSSPTFSGLVTMNGGAQLPGGQRITFTVGSEAAPSVSDQTVGARIILDALGAPNHFAIGVESGAVWENIGISNKYYNYFGASAATRHSRSLDEYRVDSDGALFTLNFQSSNVAPGALRFNTNQGNIQFALADVIFYEMSATRLRPFIDNALDFGDSSHRIKTIFGSATTGYRLVNNTGGQCAIIAGTGSPEGAVTGSPCWVYLRYDGSTNLYVKQTGVDTTAGWVAK